MAVHSHRAAAYWLDPLHLLFAFPLASNPIQSIVGQSMRLYRVGWWMLHRRARCSGAKWHRVYGCSIVRSRSAADRTSSTSGRACIHAPDRPGLVSMPHLLPDHDSVAAQPDAVSDDMVSHWQADRCN